MGHELVVAPDAETLSARAAAFVAAHARSTVSERGRFTFAVSGGHTPWAMFADLVKDSLPWEHVQIFQVDERVAPDGAPERNLTHLQDALGDLPAEVTPMPVTDADLEDAAGRYAELLPDPFNLIHLGLGPDGHTASLVPSDPVLEVTDRLVAVTGPYQGHRRMTLTYPALERTDQILWLISGEDKREALGKLLAGDPSIPGGRASGSALHHFGGRRRRGGSWLAMTTSGPEPTGGSSRPIRLLLADVDGTLVTQDKALTDQAVDAVHRLGDADIRFAITSGRPPRGMEMLVGPLGLDTPIAAFNGGLIVNPDMTVITRRVLPEPLVLPLAELMGSFNLSVWIYRGTDWYVPDLNGPHVASEAWTVKFDPTLMSGLAELTHDVAKMVGVSDDHDAVSRASVAVHDRFGDHVTAAPSQPYYLDITHPRANKGEVAKYMAERYHLSADEIATIGDQPNDVLMFAHSGLSIAMGNANPEVQRSARRVTDTNENNGFAAAVFRFVLPH